MKRSGPIPRSTRLHAHTPLRGKSDRRRLAQAVDLKVKALALDRDGHKCVRCGKTQKLQAAHILPKGRVPKLRFEEQNILTLCVGCHLFFAHKDPLGFAAWLAEVRPGLYDRLLILAATAGRVDVKQLAVVYGVSGIETPARPNTTQGARLPTEGIEHK